ncbi:MAG: isoprenyl transferase [Clostridia bacterium]|nr:isoprenyl transferase [Clostridia bacterium]
MATSGEHLIDKNNLPQHIAFIMDGNGRWAKKRGKPRTFGHAEGAKVFERIVEKAGDIGIPHLTFYAFSTENWKRPKQEVDTIMQLLRDYLKTGFRKIEHKDVRINVIGDLTGLAPDLQEEVHKLMERTKDRKKMIVNLALNYGGRDEIVRAVKKMVEEAEGGISPEDITDAALSAHMDTYLSPDPDLIVRPSGEYRLSNFLIWQCAYAEFWFSDILWPDFSEKDLVDCILAYQGRNRRYGGV